MNTHAWPNDEDLARMKRSIGTGIGHHRARQHRRRAIAGIGAAALALGGGTAGAVLITANQDAAQSSVYCYSAASTGAPAVQAANATSLDRAGALEVCGLIWARGGLVQGGTGNPTPGAQNPIPPLQVCLRPDNIRGVFPLDDRKTGCADLGLRDSP